MIKFIIHITRAIIAVAIAMLFASCNLGGGIKGNGTVTTQDHTIRGSFTGISVSGNIEVYIEQNGIQNVTVEADENLQKHIKTELNGNQLVIKTDVNITDATAKRITVTMPVIKSIECSAAALVKSKTVLKADAIEVTCSSASNTELALLTKQLTCSASSGSMLKIAGSTGNLIVHGSSGSQLNAKKLTATNVTANASSGSNVTVNPIQSLMAEASSGGLISYINAPVSLSKRASSGGNINKE